jgi:hypothetical protein
MNSERLYTISMDLYAEITGSNLVATMTQLTGQLQQAINSPGENTQRAVENTLNKLYETLRSANSNSFSPGIRAAIEELKVNGRPVSNLIGTGLTQQLKITFEGGYTSVQTLDKLRQIETDIKAFADALGKINSSFKTLDMKDEKLNPGESIVGMIIPRSAINGGLRELQREIAFFAQFLVELTEVVEGTPHENKIYSLHASEFGIDVLGTLNVAACFANIIVGIKVVFDTLREFKELKEKAERLELGKKLTDDITKKGKERMKSKLNELHAEIFQNTKVTDGGRRNELETGIGIRLNGLANRIDRGFSFEVRTALPATPSDDEQEKAKIVVSFGSVRFEPIAGPRLIDFPEVDEKEMKRQKKQTKSDTIEQQ